MDEQELRWSQYIQKIGKQKPGLVAAVEQAIHDGGPLTAADLDHLETSERGKRGSWWDLSDTKKVLEYLFFRGRAAVAGRPNFNRVYGSPAQVWGTAASEPPVEAEHARQQLFDLAISASGIGTVADFADHFRFKKTPAQGYARSAVARGLAEWVSVEGWKQPALLATGAHEPGRATGAALLSPFDSLVWFRERDERLKNLVDREGVVRGDLLVQVEIVR